MYEDAALSVECVFYGKSNLKNVIKKGGSVSVTDVTDSLLHLVLPNVPELKQPRGAETIP